ncbi:MAG: carbohydrate porin [Pseudomonas sp.]|uniref:carbohydrate porin n=1 Tax=Pseudomonas abieticivorans TaxID=2931382 RepID=UPI0020C0B2C1|nr:carbohydrate porin [Pseudomonas sp. PIA16]MDE1169414.1 carbohydrate porin [Pseudomonas sp.]
MSRSTAPRFQRRHATLLLALCAAAATPLTAEAQDAFAADSQWMTGDWGGQRTALLDKGVDIQMGYTGETASNLRGGYNKNHTTRYADQFTLGAAIDLQKLMGWQDTQFMVLLSNTNGDSLNDQRISDPRAGSLSATQEISGNGSVTRLSELWLSKGWFNDALNVKAGRFAFGDDFAVEDCLFENLAFCSSQPGNYVDSITVGPVSTWAARVKYTLNDEVYAQLGVFDVNDSYGDNNNGFKLNGAGTTGAMIPVELVWTPTLNNLPGEYRVGYYYSTANADDLYKDANNLPAAVTGDDYRRDDSRHGWWLTGKQQLTTVGGDASRGLVLYGNVSAFDAATTPVDSLLKISLVYKGPFDARPADTLGLAVARLHSSNQYLRNARAANQASGLSYADADYVPEQHSEYDIELNYGIQVTQWLNVRPNLQYVAHPGGVREVQNAVVAGLQVQSQF